MLIPVVMLLQMLLGRTGCGVMVELAREPGSIASKRSRMIHHVLERRAAMRRTRSMERGCDAQRAARRSSHSVPVQWVI
jgi:hypothetical protein